MFSGPKAKSLEYHPTSSTGGVDAKGAALRKSQSYAHRRRSSIPKPSPEAPLFRNDPVDRYCSKIPYPKSKGNLYYDILTGDQCWRHGKSMEQRPRGGLSNLLARRVKANPCSQPKVSRADEQSGPLSLSPPTSGMNPAMSDSIHSEDHSSSSSSQNNNNNKFQEHPHVLSPHTLLLLSSSYSSNASEISCFSTRSLCNASFTSQNTVLEYGSEMTDFMDYLGNQTYYHPGSPAASETSCDTSLDDLSDKDEATRFPTLTPSFWKGCVAAVGYSNGHQRELNVVDPKTRVPSGSEVSATNLIGDRGHGHHAMPSSTTSTHRSMFYKVGRFRRRPQVPVSEASDATESEDDLILTSVADAAVETKRKRSFTDVIYDLFTKKSSSLTKAPRSTATPEEDAADRVSVCSRKSSKSSIDSSFGNQMPQRFQPYDWIQRDSFETSNVLEMTVDEKPPHGNAVCQSGGGWIRAAIGFSCKALVVISVAALGHFLKDGQEKEDRDIRQQREEDIHDNLNLEQEHLSFSEYAMVSLTGPTTYSYPISLLESLSDSDV